MRVRRFPFLRKVILRPSGKSQKYQVRTSSCLIKQATILKAMCRPATARATRYGFSYICTLYTAVLVRSSCNTFFRFFAVTSLLGPWLCYRVGSVHIKCARTSQEPDTQFRAYQANIFDLNRQNFLLKQQFGAANNEVLKFGGCVLVCASSALAKPKTLHCLPRVMPSLSDFDNTCVCELLRQCRWAKNSQLRNNNYTVSGNLLI